MRAAVVLRYYEDMSEAEIAGVLGISLGTVKSTVSRAVAKLRIDAELIGDFGVPQQPGPVEEAPALAELLRAGTTRRRSDVSRCA
jgi:Sigma-70, region 4